MQFSGHHLCFGYYSRFAVLQMQFSGHHSCSRYYSRFVNAVFRASLRFQILFSLCKCSFQGITHVSDIIPALQMQFSGHHSFFRYYSRFDVACSHLVLNPAYRIHVTYSTQPASNLGPLSARQQKRHAFWLDFTCLLGM